MESFKLKHRVDGAGRFKLMWNWVQRSSDPTQFYYNYWLTFDSQEDAKEHYEKMVMGAWPSDVKWEIVDLQADTTSPK